MGGHTGDESRAGGRREAVADRGGRANAVDAETRHHERMARRACEWSEHRREQFVPVLDERTDHFAVVLAVGAERGRGLIE